MTDYCPATDSTASYYAAIAEIRRRKVIAGELEPITDEEREIGEGNDG